MLGAICGDIVGSIYEANNIKEKDFIFFKDSCRFTDDSVMTAAISKACCRYVENKNQESFKNDCIRYMQELGRNHINAGYGGTFIYWLLSDTPKPYNSYGNGSAMRVSPVAWVSETLEEAERLAKLSAEVSHNHPYGIAGAQAVAGSIWIMLHGGNKRLIKKYIEDNYYKLDFKLDDIREKYEFDVTCQGSLPQAIEAFIESKNYEDAIRNAISIGGDSDTIAAITGSLAEAYYGMPKELKRTTISYLDNDLKICVKNFYNKILKQQKVKNKSSEDKEER